MSPSNEEQTSRVYLRDIFGLYNVNNAVLICAIIFGGNKSLYRTQRQ